MGDQTHEGTALHNLGSVYESLGEYQKALEFYEQSLAISRELSAREGEGITLGQMGILYDNWGFDRRSISAGLGR